MPVLPIPAPSRLTRWARAAGIPALALAAASAPARPSTGTARAPNPADRTAEAVALPAKRLDFAILEDYDKGHDLADVERDFLLFRELGVTTWRGSFGWDDYEPSPGKLDVAWLHRFASLAARHGIRLRPYLGYTPEWAAVGRRKDGQVWNDPPKRLDHWARFAGAIARELRRHPNVVSYEIYNEENVSLWWDGTAAEYAAVVARGAAAIRAAHPGAQVLLGGLVWPDVEWVETVCETSGNAVRIDVIPVHAYPETWTSDSVTVETYLGQDYAQHFLPAVDRACGPKPIWINETGFATAKGRTERDQAAWWARAIATFAATPRVEHIGIYEIKDLRPGSDVIGDPENFHLGITRADRTKKLAFSTVKLLAGLLSGPLTVANGDVQVTPAAAAGAPPDAGEPGARPPDVHLFRRPDGRQVLVAWVRRGARPARVDLTLTRPGGSATEYALDGTPSVRSGFDGRVLRDVELVPGEVRIIAVAPPGS